MTRYLVLVVLSAGCGAVVSGPAPAVSVDAGSDAGDSGGTPTGHVVYLANGRLYRIAAQPGAVPEDLTAELTGGTGSWVDSAPDGAWLVYAGDAGCADYSGCLMRAPVGDGGVAYEVRPGGASVHPVGRSTIAAGGDVIVYAAPGTHALDLFATTRTGDAWSAPVELTAGSDRAYNQLPRFSADGATIAFDCGADVYSQTATTICEVASDGSGFRALFDPWPAAGMPGERHHAGLAADGSLVFEADADGERIWRLAPGAVLPVVVGNFNNDNTPCALPDGRIASLYLGRPGNTGAHELKVMDPDGRDPLMLVTFGRGDGITDTGLGCGE